MTTILSPDTFNHMIEIKSLNRHSLYALTNKPSGTIQYKSILEGILKKVDYNIKDMSDLLVHIFLKDENTKEVYDLNAKVKYNLGESTKLILTIDRKKYNYIEGANTPKDIFKNNIEDHDIDYEKKLSEAYNFIDTDLKNQEKENYKVLTKVNEYRKTNSVLVNVITLDYQRKTLKINTNGKLNQIFDILYPGSNSHNLAIEITDFNNKNKIYHLSGYTDMFAYRFNEKDILRIVRVSSKLYQYDIKYNDYLVSIGVFNNNNTGIKYNIKDYCYNNAMYICGINTWYKYHHLNDKLENTEIITLTNKAYGQVFVKTLTGRTITFNFDSHDPVLKIMKYIKDREDININQQRLIFGGKQFEINKSMGMYRVKKESTLHLVLRLCGGMLHETSGRNGNYKPLTTVFFVI
jgi:hypothetical protein